MPVLGQRGPEPHPISLLGPSRRKLANKNSVRSRSPAKYSKSYGTLRKVPAGLEPKPQQVKKIFEALKQGLK